jgi:outer membrane immunogenic protein
MKRTAFLVALLTTTSLASAALAADLPRKAPPPAPIPYTDWSGVYVGLGGGYGWGHQNNALVIPGQPVTVVDQEGSPPLYSGVLPVPVAPDFAQQTATFFAPDVAVPSPHQHGWLFGGFAGVQKQWGSWVLGLEGDFYGANIKGSGASSATSVFDVVFAEFPGNPGSAIDCPKCLSLTHSVSIESKIDMLGSLRGKVGFVLAPDWMVYGTGGLAFAHVKDTIFDTQSAHLAPISVSSKFPVNVFLTSGGAVISNGIFSSFGASGGTSMLGWAAGAGVDWKFWHDAGSAWVFGVEYLHYGFGTNTVTFQTSNGNSLAMSFNQSVDTIKGRISYLFSIR